MAENTDDRPARLRMSGKYEITKLRAEIERLTAAKKAALKIADERGRENDGLRAALVNSSSLFAAILHESRPEKEIEDQLLENRAALEQRVSK